MKLVPVSCQNCGASLDIPGDARFVTCQFCDTRLAVQHTGSAIFTELIGELTKKTDRVVENLEVIRIQNEIEKLDREWQEQKEPLMHRSKNGRVSEPSIAASLFGGIVMMGFGIFWLTSAPGGMALVGLLPLGAGLYAMISGPMKAEQYRQAREAYESARRTLESRLGSQR